MNYTHINYEERVLIEHYFNLNYSINKIAKEINRSASTISRELKRNFDSNIMNYNSNSASQLARKRRYHRFYFKFFSIREEYEAFNDIFTNVYNKTIWTVELLHFAAKYLFKFKCPSLRTTFNWIKSGNWVLVHKDLLRKSYVKGGKRKNTTVVDRLVQSEYVIPYWARPKEINNRSEFGHWEIDLICGKNARGHYHIITLVERQTRFAFTEKIKGKHPDNLNRILLKMIAKYNIPVFSITTDNGFEFRKLGLIGYKLGICIYQCDKYASWQKGSDENWNGLFRRFFPKGTDFNDISPEEIQRVTTLINKRLRKTLNYKSAEELYVDAYNKTIESL